MELSKLRPVFEHAGPFVTVYMEGRSPGEDAGEQMRLRWRALREQLEAAGAPAESVSAIESALLGNASGEEQTDGRVLVAAGSDVVLDAAWDAALGAGDAAHFGDVPELGAYVREEARSVRELVVIADQQGAQVRQEVVAQQHEVSETDAEIVEGGAKEGVHKPRGGALSHNQIQRRADEAVEHNAKDIVAHLHGVSSTFRPRVLVLAGAVQARTAIREQLPNPLAEILVETERGGRDEHASDTALTEELLRIASEESTRSAGDYTERLQAGLAHGHAVQGEKDVAKAAEAGAVDTLLFESGQPAPREASLLQSCAEASSTLGLVAEETALTDGVGALLRFPLPT